MPTYICARPDDLQYTLDHLDELVVKAVNESGGYGMLMGPTQHRRPSGPSSRAKIRANPRNYIAQPVVTLSTCPTWTDEGVGPAARRSAAVHRQRQTTWVLPGGLTRTALVEGVAGGQLQPGRRQQGYLGVGER